MSTYVQGLQSPKYKVASMFSGALGLELGLRQFGTQMQKFT